MWNAISLVRIWTRVAVFISYDDNHYTTGKIAYKPSIYESYPYADIAYNGNT